MTAHSTPQLDDLDTMLIRELEANARQTNVDLARKLQVNRNTLKARLQKLLDDGIIKILPIEDPLAQGYKTRVHVGFKTQLSEIDVVANTLASYENIHHVAIFTGRYDLMAWAVLANPEDLPGFVSKELTRIAGITSIETMVKLEIVKNSYSFLSDKNYTFRTQPPQPALDDLDLKLIKPLRSNALQTQNELAPKLGASPSTVRRRLRRLLDESIIRIVAVADPTALGYKTRATIGINAQPHRIDAVARELASFRNVHHILMNTGSSDLIVSTDFREPQDLSRFLREDLGNMQDLVRYETMVCLKTVKDDFALVT